MFNPLFPQSVHPLRFVNCLRAVFALIARRSIRDYGSSCADGDRQISGQITDPAGRVIPKAGIKIVNLATGVAQRD